MQTSRHQSESSGGIVIPFPHRGWEPWVTKQQLANHLAYSTRWVEKQIVAGMPYAHVGSRKRFRISECERWLAERRTA